jgi:NAD dependent epimerase/dehydratase family
VYGDGRQTRDYVYVSDVVDAWIAAAESEVTGALNISSGVEVSVLELVAEIGLEHELARPRPGEVARSCLDPTQAQHRIGWNARVPLREGLRRTLDALRPTKPGVAGSEVAADDAAPSRKPDSAGDPLNSYLAEEPPADSGVPSTVDDLDRDVYG